MLQSQSQVCQVGREKPSGKSRAQEKTQVKMAGDPQVDDGSDHLAAYPILRQILNSAADDYSDEIETHTFKCLKKNVTVVYNIQL
jgi:hypothetical protein